MGVLVLEGDGAAGFVESHGQTSGLTLDDGGGAVVEDREGAVRVPAGVVLPGERDLPGHGEVAVLAAQPPEDLSGAAVDLVDRPGVAGRDQQVAVGVDVDR